MRVLAAWAENMVRKNYLTRKVSSMKAYFNKENWILGSHRCAKRERS